MVPVLNIPLPSSTPPSQGAYSRVDADGCIVPFLIPVIALMMWANGVRFTGIHLIASLFAGFSFASVHTFSHRQVNLDPFLRVLVRLFRCVSMILVSNLAIFAMSTEY